MNFCKSTYGHILVLLFVSNTIYPQLGNYKLVEEKFGLNENHLIDYIYKVENNIYISSNSNKELWVYDTSTDETVLIYSGDSNVYPGEFVKYNDYTYFTLLCAEGLSVMKTQNTISTTKKIHQFDTEYYDTAFELFVYDNHLFLVENSNTTFYILNDQHDTVDEIYDLIDWNDDGKHFGSRFLKLGDQLLIKGNIDGEDVLWKVVEFPLKKLELITDENDDPIKGISRTLLFNNKLYFSSSTDDERKSWFYDGTSTSAKLFKEAEIRHTQNNETLESPFTILDMSDDSHGSEPWIFDGTIEGTYLLKDIIEDGSSLPSHFHFHKGKINFRTFDRNTRISQRWESDGTIKGTVSVSEYKLGAISKVIGDRQFDLIPINKNELILSEYLGGGASKELFRLKGILVAGVDQFSSIRDEIFFFHARNSQYYNYVSDGTAANTFELDNLNSERLRYTFSLNGNTYFILGSESRHNFIYRVAHDSISYNSPFIIEDLDSKNVNICNKTF